LTDVPVLVGADRVKNAKTYLGKNKADIFILDDGFQHWRLSRDLDIVVVDSTNPWGNGHLLPRGILREPRGALVRAQIFVLTKTDIGRDRLQDIKKDLSVTNPRALMVEAVHAPVCFLDGRSGGVEDIGVIKGRTVCAVSSIGAPGSFTETLVNLGADVKEHVVFMDHHVYGPGDIERIVKLCREREVVMLVTTEKDAVKLKPFLNLCPRPIRVLFLRIKMSVVQGEEAFLERIYRLL
jgi:tetraacyldisaccharide 4'-kinase